MDVEVVGKAKHQDEGRIGSRIAAGVQGIAVPWDVVLGVGCLRHVSRPFRRRSG